MKGFNSIYDSDLLQHEVTYALGQMKIVIKSLIMIYFFLTHILLKYPFKIVKK